jgi:hypothetical protein
MKPGIGGEATNGRFGPEPEFVLVASTIMGAACWDQRLALVASQYFLGNG